MTVTDFKLFDLPQAERERLAVMLASFFKARPEVELALLFGPFIAGRPFRWVDVGVGWRPGVGDTDRAAALLERALSRTYGLRWAVRNLDAAGSLLRWQATCGLPVHADRPDRLVNLCRRSWPPAWDFVPKLRRWLDPAT